MLLRSNSFTNSSLTTLLDEKSMLPQLPTQGAHCTFNHPAIQALRVQQVLGESTTDII